MIRKRASGVLLHITSLPSRHGIGDFGPGACKFVNFLAQARQHYWQVLPFGPVSSNSRYSPYNSISAFAGNTLFISPDLLYEQGLLTRKELQYRPVFPKAQVDYRRVSAFKQRLLNVAFGRFKSIQKKQDYFVFCEKNKRWLEDFAIFVALYHHYRTRQWCDWPVELRDRKERMLRSIMCELREPIEREKFAQYVFFKQWSSLRRYCGQQGIRIIGDIPFYVAYNSPDVWANPEIFKLTRAKKPRFVAGVPPDLFSRTGQLWGNPVYDWRVLQKTGYEWWLRRIKHNLRLFDIVRIDHFRGFVASWQVPVGGITAVNGRWVRGPAEDLFAQMLKDIPSRSFIVEDLGFITADVKELVQKFSLTGVRVLLFGFNRDESANRNWPGNYVKNCVVYTGTHDNNTVRGWFEKEAKLSEKERLFECLGHRATTNDLHWELINLAMSSAANTVIIPMQDVLGLGGEARMNRPASIRGNWKWRLAPGQTTLSLSKRLATLTERCKRS